MKLDCDKLVALLLDEPWHTECEIVPDSMPPHPGPDTRPRCVIRHNNGTEHPAFLRYSNGPKQVFWWDVYGDDMVEPELALLALIQAPTPRNVGPLVVKFPISDKPTAHKEIPDGH